MKSESKEPGSLSFLLKKVQPKIWQNDVTVSRYEHSYGGKDQLKEHKKMLSFLHQVTYLTLSDFNKILNEAQKNSDSKPNIAELVNQQDSTTGETVLSNAAAYSREPALLERLFELKADPTRGKSPFQAIHDRKLNGNEDVQTIHKQHQASIVATLLACYSTYNFTLSQQDEKISKQYQSLTDSESSTFRRRSDVKVTPETTPDGLSPKTQFLALQK